MTVMSLSRPHREDLLHQVSPSGQRSPGLLILRPHCQNVEPGEWRTGQNSHRTRGPGGWPKTTKDCQKSLLFFPKSSCLIFLSCFLLLLFMFRCSAWRGAQTASCWPRFAKMEKFASMTLASPLHLYRYVMGNVI